MAAELSRKHPTFGVNLIDALLEEIRIGLETNVFKFNPKSIAQVRYLAEFYNYRLLKNEIIFQTLYFMLTFGYRTFFYLFEL